METPATSKDPGQFLHKNRLQEFAQKSSIPLPVYETPNEGNAQAPRFRSTVLVNGMKFTSPQTFKYRKAAEQDVAKLALESLSRKIEDEAVPLIYEGSIFCKSILHEYTMKMNLEKPTYTTNQAGAKLPVFTSATIFNGQTYTGNAAKSKKEAEQMAACTVIQSILASSDTRAVMSEIVRSKQKLYNALPLPSHSQNNSNGAVYGNEPSANLTSYTLPVSISQEYEQISKATHEVEEFKEGHTYELGYGTNRSGVSQPTILQCGSLGTSGSSDGPQNNSNGAVYGNEPSANLTSYTLPVSISQESEQISKATHEVKEFKEGHTYELGYGTNISGVSQPTILQCGLLGTSGSSDGPQNNDGVKQIGPSTRPEGSPGVVLTSGMNTTEEGPKYKKTRTVE